MLNQTVCALQFFYGVTLGHADIPERIAYARSPRTLPVVLSADEVVRFLEAVPSLKTRTALTTAYAAGLRASETVDLKVGDIDRERGVILVCCRRSCAHPAGLLAAGEAAGLAVLRISQRRDSDFTKSRTVVSLMTGQFDGGGSRLPCCVHG